jgi:hypothetical protein
MDTHDLFETFLHKHDLYDEFQYALNHRKDKNFIIPYHSYEIKSWINSAFNWRSDSAIDFNVWSTLSDTWYNLVTILEIGQNMYELPNPIKSIDK